MTPLVAASRRLLRLLGLLAAQLAVVMLVATTPAHALERMHGFDRPETVQITTDSAPVELAAVSVCHCASHCPGEVFDLPSSVAAPELRAKPEAWGLLDGLAPTGLHCSFLERPPRG